MSTVNQPLWQCSSRESGVIVPVTFLMLYLFKAVFVLGPEKLPVTARGAIMDSHQLFHS
jgi:hypothetical protein